MPPEPVGMGSIMNLIIQAVLNEIALLLRAVAQFNSAVIDCDMLRLQFGNGSEFIHLHNIGFTVDQSTSSNLFGRTNIAEFAYAIVSVVVGALVHISDPAGSLAEERAAGKRIDDALFRLRWQDLSTANFGIDIGDAGKTQMLANFGAMKQAGEDGGIDKRGKRKRAADMLIAVIEPRDQWSPVQDRLCPGGLLMQDAQRVFGMNTIDGLNSIVIDARPGDEDRQS